MMRGNGLVKLAEESGELVQVACKLIAYPELQQPSASENGCLHPDGTDLRLRLEQETADVLAAIEFVIRKLDLDPGAINRRAGAKLATFKQWDNEP